MQDLQSGWEGAHAQEMARAQEKEDNKVKKSKKKEQLEVVEEVHTSTACSIYYAACLFSPCLFMQLAASLASLLYHFTKPTKLV